MSTSKIKNEEITKEDKMKEILFQCFDILFANEQIPITEVLDRKSLKKENRKRSKN